MSHIISFERGRWCQASWACVRNYTLPTKGKTLQRASMSKPSQLITYCQCRAANRCCSGAEHQAHHGLSRSPGYADTFGLQAGLGSSWLCSTQAVLYGK